MASTQADNNQAAAEMVVGLSIAEADWLNCHRDNPAAERFRSLLSTQRACRDAAGEALLAVALEDVRRAMKGDPL